MLEVLAMVVALGAACIGIGVGGGGGGGGRANQLFVVSKTYSRYIHLA